MKGTRKKHAKDGLQSKVNKSKLVLEDVMGKYLPMCTYHQHPGLVERPSVCNTRKCPHYAKLYLDSTKGYEREYFGLNIEGEEQI
jgi:hypothetical protein|tara:strand:- start:310 stop:564 length:255 start_codon:yes stop_codon:yes gene_type:complete